MQLEILKGKEIQFIQSIDIYLRTINNDEQTQTLLNCFSIKTNDFDLVYKLIEKTDYNVITTIFERLYNKKSISINNAGKKYLEFTTESFYTFLESPQCVQITTVYILWNAISLNSETNKINSELQVAYAFYTLMLEFESSKSDILNTYFNSPGFKNKFLQTFPFNILNINSNSHTYYIPDKSTLIPLDINNHKESQSIYTILDSLIYRIEATESGYSTFFTEVIDKEKININNLEFSTGLFTPYKYESTDDFQLIYRKTQSSITTKIQSEYNNYTDILRLNPSSRETNLRKKATHTFISLIYSIVKRAYTNSKVSTHLIETITGLIAYDLRILELDSELDANNNSKEINSIIRKRVSGSINSNNKLKLNY